MSNQKRIFSTVIWSGVEKFANSGIQLILNLILANLIIPEEFGLVAMLSILISIGQTFIDSGFSQSLIHKQNRSREDYSTVFFFNIAISLLFYAFVFLLAPFISVFYKNPVFTKLTRIVGLNLIISSFSIVQRAILIIRTDFRTQSIISLISTITGGVFGIILAYRGYGVWAMVCQSLLFHSISVFLLWLFVKWRPSFLFSISSFKELFSYGSKLLGSRLLNTICQNIHTMLIGRFFSQSKVAYFNNANLISLYSAGYLNEIITRAMFPFLCEVQDEREKIRSLFVKQIRFSCFVIFPIMASIIVLARPFVLVVLNENWIGSITLIQILAFAYMWYPLMSINQMFNVIGRTDLNLKCEVFKKIFFVIVVLITVFMNVEAMCWGIVFYNFIEIIITMFILNKVFPIKIKELLMNILPSLVITIVMALIVSLFCTFIDSDFLQLILGCVLAILIYFLINLIIHSEDLFLLLKLIKIK